MGARSCPLVARAAFHFVGPRRNGSRFFCALTLLLAACPAPAADSWDLLLSVDADGRVSVLSHTAVADVPAPPAQPLREGLTCLELRDAEGRLLDRRAVPLPSQIYFDHEPAPGSLQGGALPAPALQYHLRIPRRDAGRQRLSFYAVRAPRAAPLARAAVLRETDFLLDARGEAVLDGLP
jgi:hypothetical protein